MDHMHITHKTETMVGTKIVKSEAVRFPSTSTAMSSQPPSMRSMPSFSSMSQEEQTTSRQTSSGMVAVALESMIKSAKHDSDDDKDRKKRKTKKDKKETKREENKTNKKKEKNEKTYKKKKEEKNKNKSKNNTTQQTLTRRQSLLMGYRTGPTLGPFLTFLLTRIVCRQRHGDGHPNSSDPFRKGY